MKYEIILELKKEIEDITKQEAIRNFLTLNSFKVDYKVKEVKE